MTRRDHLHEYVLALLRTGSFDGVRSHADLVRCLGTYVVADVGEVLAELAANATQEVAARGAQLAGDFAARASAQATGVSRLALDKLAGWFDHAREVGLGRAWRELQDAYWRGAAAQGRR